jgi:hypothetical protein
MALSGKMIVVNKLERIWMEAVVACLRYYPSIVYIAVHVMVVKKECGT